MTKETIIFVCSNCDAQFQKWTGQCFECGKWGTVENKTAITDNKSGDSKVIGVGVNTQKLGEIKNVDSFRNSSKIGELDRVLGGGIVPGSLILLGGEPGIGKSTLSLQIANNMKKSLYISGEESINQIKMRADRLGNANADMLVMHENDIENICATIKKESPEIVIIDSIQTMISNDTSGEPGNVNQVRVCATKLLDSAKQSKSAIVIIGHVTKDGSVAGPKTLEHLVDTVLYIEGDRYYQTRLLRTIKNRFGSTDEVGVFEMNELGLKEVKNPSSAFLEERADDTPGSVVTCLIEGTRPLLIEVQALVNKTSFGYPVRKASGFDLNRLHVLVAVLQKRAGLQLGQYDIHVNVVGGLKAQEPAADLAVCLAIASSFKDKVLGGDLVVFGEVGLGGEVRRVNQSQKRIKECEKLGMQRVVTSKNPGNVHGTKIIEVKNLV